MTPISFRSKLLGHLSCLLVLLSAAPMEGGIVDKKSGFSLALDSYHRDYSEQAPRPLKSDEEGWLLGGVLGVELNLRNHLHATLDVDYADWKTDFDGTDQVFGIPLGAETQNTFFTIETDVGYIFDNLLHPKSATVPFALFGYKRWDRDVRPDDPFTTIGADEDYNWWYFGAGAKTVLEFWDGAGTMGLGIKAMRMIEGQIEIRTRSIVETPRLNLGDRWHFEVEAPFTFRLTEHVSTLVAPYYRREKIGRSNDAVVSAIKDIDEAGFVTEPVSIHEPSSDADSWGWRTGIIVSF